MLHNRIQREYFRARAGGGNDDDDDDDNDGDIDGTASKEGLGWPMAMEMAMTTMKPSKMTLRGTYLQLGGGQRPPC